MYEETKSVKDGGDYSTLLDALADKVSGVTVLLLAEQISDSPIVISQPISITAGEEGCTTTIRAPLIKFDMLPSVFCMCSNIKFIGKVEIVNGSTVTFDSCDFCCPEDAGQIEMVKVVDSSPSIKNCQFHDFNGIGVAYYGTKGGIISDCIFENISGEMIQKNDESKPFSQYNKKK